MSGIQAFLGKWREETKDGFDAMADTLGLPLEKKNFFKEAKTEISYDQDGDTCVIDVGIQGIPKREFRFKFGEQYDSASLDGSPMKSVVEVQGDKLVEKHIDESLNGAEMNIVRWIEGDKMVVQTSCAGLTMTSRYERI